MINAKYIFSPLFFVFAVFLFNSCSLLSKNAYWADFDTHAQKRIIKDKSVNDLAKLIYSGKDCISDNEESFVLFEEITSFSHDKRVDAFYYYVFNEICQSADGAVAEVLGYYCLNSLVNSTEYNLRFFTRNYSLLHKYAEYIAYELDQNQEAIEKYNMLKKRIQYICRCNHELMEVSNILQTIIEENYSIMTKEQ